MRQTIDGAAFCRMAISAAASIENYKQPINDLNVFPVPDGDTGTNMSMTFQNAVTDLQRANNPTLTKACDMVASALLRGARGNSGVILSLLFRGFAKGMKEKTSADGFDFALALSDGVEAAYKAVMKPAEGTILTVSRVSAAAGVEAAAEDAAVEFVLEHIIEAAKKALSETTNQNPVLKKAGVVDAGGMGYLKILEGMLASLQGNDVEFLNTAGSTNDAADFANLTDEDITFTFDTVFIVRKNENTDLDAFREYLNSIGDSLVIGEDDDVFKVHVHTDIPGEALNEAQKHGVLEVAKIENMRTQYEDMAAGRKPQSTDDLDMDEAAAPAEPDFAEAEKKSGVVAVCAGKGLAEVFQNLGVDRIVEGGQTMNPSTQDILVEINKVPAEIVYVLPNNKNIIMAAEQAIPLTEKKVVVIPTKTVPQGVTAMLSFDPEGEIDDNQAAMESVLDTVATMQITYAARDSDFDGFLIHEGDYMALNGSALFGTSTEMLELVGQLAEHTARADREFITIYYGQDVAEEVAQKAQQIFSAACPDAEVNLLFGGQPVYYFLISAE
ncbi:MAG: DAK2 domain-containing protein [Ruminococcaceae bacterium]|nr:DAK2 domain-containing protein [Oscillospiraceae bacterium]